MNLAPHGAFGASGISLVCFSFLFLVVLVLLAVHRWDLVVTPSTTVIVGWVLVICERFGYFEFSEFW